MLVCLSMIKMIIIWEYEYLLPAGVSRLRKIHVHGLLSIVIICHKLKSDASSVFICSTILKCMFDLVYIYLFGFSEFWTVARLFNVKFYVSKSCPKLCLVWELFSDLFRPLKSLCNTHFYYPIISPSISTCNPLFIPWLLNRSGKKRCFTTLLLSFAFSSIYAHPFCLHCISFISHRNWTCE